MLFRSRPIFNNGNNFDEAITVRQINFQTDKKRYLNRPFRYTLPERVDDNIGSNVIDLNEQNYNGNSQGCSLNAYQHIQVKENNGGNTTLTDYIFERKQNNGALIERQRALRGTVLRKRARTDVNSPVLYK